MVKNYFEVLTIKSSHKRHKNLKSASGLYLSTDNTNAHEFLLPKGLLKNNFRILEKKEEILCLKAQFRACP